jgi:hypothetical protein
VFLGVALIAATLALGAGRAEAATVDVTCVGDDDVLLGSLTATTNAAVQPILDGVLAPMPDKSAGILDIQGITEIEAGVSARTDPVDVAQGVGDVDFFVGIEFGTDLTLPVDEITLREILFELTPADGVTGTPLVGTPPDVTVPLPVPDGVGERGPFTGTFDVTAPIGGEATWDLTQAEVGIELTIPANTPLGEDLPNGLPTDLLVTLGLSCTAESNPIVRSLVLPPEDPDGPVAPDLAYTTPQDTPIEIDILSEVGEGPVAPTDPDSLEIFIEPSLGTVNEPIDGVVTYTPDAGVTGDDNFAYLVCTEPYVPEPVDTGASRGEIEQITSCNAGVVTVTMEAAEEPTTTTTEATTSTTAAPTTPPAPPQQGAGNFTG